MTPKAAQAFEDYWAQGVGRSLTRLAQEYAERSGRGEAVPTRHASRLFAWSSAYDWQALCAARTEEEATALRKRLQERQVKFRERLLVGIEADVSRYLQWLQKNEGALLAEDAASLERLTKLYFQLAGDPLAEKQQHEHSGPGGEVLRVVVERVEGHDGDSSGDGD